MTRRSASTRAAAIRRAQQAKAQRDAERLAREREIEATLADYFEAVGHAAAIRAQARRKADKVLADAETAAKPPDMASRVSVNRLRVLTGSHTDVAELCGLTLPAVRALLREDPGPCDRKSEPELAALPAEPEHPGGASTLEADR
jgi:hypothetical protein